MRNHQANVLVSGSGIGQLCEKYLSKPGFSYVHLTSSTNSSGLLPVLRHWQCVWNVINHGGCSPGWLFMGVLKSWIPHPPLLFLMVRVLGKLLLHVLCVWLQESLQELVQALESLPKPTPLHPDCFYFVFAHLAHKGTGFLVHYVARTGSSGVELNDL